MSHNPMVSLNHTRFPWRWLGVTKGLQLLDVLEAERLADNHRLDAVRARLLELAGDCTGAIRH
jgi:predicted RNA polymerase sigma factor